MCQEKLGFSYLKEKGINMDTEKQQHAKEDSVGDLQGAGNKDLEQVPY